MNRLFEQYISGANGNELDAKAGRVARVVHWLGASRYRYGESLDAAVQQQAEQELTSTIAEAKGFNKTALEIIQAAGRIPNQSDSFPSRRKTTLDAKTKEVTDKYWMNQFSYGPVDPKHKILPTPLVAPFSDMKIGDIDMPGVSLDVPLARVLITTGMHRQEDGELGGVTTEIHLNWGSYDLEDTSNFDSLAINSAIVKIDESGEVATLALGNDSGQGGRELKDVTRTTINIDEILSSLNDSVKSTVSEYDNFVHA